MAHRDEHDEERGRVTIEVWDLPVRLFHWALVLLLIGLYVSYRMGEMTWHGWMGQAVLVLVVFRLAWGVVGSEFARFSDFVRGPGAVWAYLRSFGRGMPDRPGHNPLGGWSVLAMLLVLLVQATLGLFANDDIFFDGPLRHLVSDSLSAQLTSLHRLNFYVILALVAVHVGAVLFYWLALGKNLIVPVLTGRGSFPEAEVPSYRRYVPGIVGVVLAMAVAAMLIGAIRLL